MFVKGKNGEAYNISDTPSDIMLKDLAAVIANLSGTKVVFENSDEKEKTGYSTATKSRHVYFSAGSEKNIKLTTVEDLDIFKALLVAKRSD